MTEFTNTNATNNTFEQRQELRLNNQLNVIIELGTEEKSEPVLAISQSLDISANGLRVIAHQAIPTECILRCVIRDPENDIQFLLITEVKWCRPYEVEGDYLIGLSLFDAEDTDIVEWKTYIANCCEE
jgi:PilZ domain